jgi:hypothetical protein
VSAVILQFPPRHAAKKTGLTGEEVQAWINRLDKQQLGEVIASLTGFLRVEEGETPSERRACALFMACLQRRYISLPDTQDDD